MTSKRKPQKDSKIHQIVLQFSPNRNTKAIIEPVNFKQASLINKCSKVLYFYQASDDFRLFYYMTGGSRMVNY